MRALKATLVFSATMLGAVALGTTVGIGAATDGLSSDSLMADARVGDAFSGSAARATDDPDAPISTGRWGENAPPVELAGGPAQAQVASAPPEPILLSRSTAPASGRVPSQLAMLETSAPGGRQTTPLTVPLSRVSWAPVAPRREAPPEPRINLTISDHEVTTAGSGLDIASAIFNEPVLSARQSRPLIDLRRLTLSIGAPDTVRKKGRWFVFAAGSGEALGLNLVRDPLRGWRPAGWSVEQLAEFGKAQLGIGWRKGAQQLSASVARREISAYGLSREDTVFGITFAVSGKPPPKTRYEQRLPSAR